MQDYLTIIISVLAALNLIAFILVGLDKRRSHQEDAERVPEVYLFTVAIFFASFGVLCGMYFFHHKTKKIYFPVGIGLLLAEQTVLIYLLFEHLKNKI